MKKARLVSVIVPIYNVEKYLDQCIKSIISQTYRNLEIILVDDGSTDSSGKIADTYAAKDKRIKVCHQNNAGVSSARNLGIDKATGDYVCFVDGDDYTMPDYVSYMLDLSEEYDSEIALTTEMFSIIHPNQTQDKIEVYSSEKAATEILYFNIPIGCYCKIFKRDFLDRYKLRFLPEYLMGEGFNFNTSAFQRANKIIVGRRKIYNYRLDNVDSVTTKFNMAKWLNGLDALKNIKRNLAIKNDNIMSAWRFAWWLTNYDVLRLMLGASEHRLNKNEFDRCLSVVESSKINLFRVSGSIFRKARIIMIFINPIIAARIDNYRRNKKMKKVNKIDGAIVCITTNNNYGNVIQRFALQRFLQNNGYGFISYYFYGYYIRQYLIRQTIIFAPIRILLYTILGKKRYLRKSSSLYNYRRLSDFCRKRIKQELFIPHFVKKYKTYIVGSDQVFNYGVISKEFFVSWKNFFLSFVKWDSKRIVYAASFGNERLAPKDIKITKEENKKRVQKFNAISVRENSGVAISRDIWGVKVREVIDPTLLLSNNDYLELINHSLYGLYKVKPLFYYILRDDAGGTLLNFARLISRQLDKKIDGINTSRSRELPAVEQWLKGFIDAEFVVTDSFHGVVFSIINHKEFVVFCFTKFRNVGGYVRYQNLLDKLGIVDRVIYEDDFNNFDVKNLKPIDWLSVDRKLNKLRESSASWLLSQLGNINE